MKLIKKLEELGLNKKEATLYVALLELGEANLQSIVNKAKLKRTTVYDIVDSLKEKGLIGATKRKKRIYYYAESPKIIKTIFEEKINKLEGVLPELLSIANLIEKKPKIQFFEGVEGIKNVYRDTLKYKNSKMMAWASNEAMTDFDIDWLWDDYVIKRAKNKIWQDTIAMETPKLKHLQTYDQEHLREMRLIKAKTQNLFEVEIDLYSNNKIGIMSFKEEFGLIIESTKIYNTLKTIFELQWQSLK